MTKKNCLLLSVVAVLAVVYVAYFTSWFKPENILISHTSRNLRSGLWPAGTMPPLTFVLRRPFEFTEIKVVPLAGWQTNDQVLPLWHLVSDSNSVPVQLFSYGSGIRGMRAAVAGTRAQPLETNVTYRLFITAGKLKGRHDFEIGGRPPEAK
jgi:hypothetical protein